MIIEIEGRRLPGLECRPDAGGPSYQNVHVGPGSLGQAIDLVRGDEGEAHWSVEIKVDLPVGDPADFRGPLVEGRRGFRFLYLNWGEVAADGSFTMFRRAKVILSEIPAGLLDRALEGSGRLVATVQLTDAKGNPICARLRPPDIAWNLVPR